jgi:hypothetical protein
MRRECGKPTDTAESGQRTGEDCMADIVLAEHSGLAWLVSGEQYIDDLLANTLPDDISIEFVACESHSDVTDLWVQNCGASRSSCAPWVIHPAIANRIRRTQSGHSVFFGQWSGMLDDDARAVIRSAASWAEASGHADMVLTCYIEPDSPRLVTDLANLRCGLIEAELIGHGIAASRIGRDTRDATSVPGIGADNQRIDIVVKSA